MNEPKKGFEDISHLTFSKAHELKETDNDRGNDSGGCPDVRLHGANRAARSVGEQRADALSPWRTIETAPRDGKPILVWDDDVNGYEVAFWSVTFKRWIDNQFDDDEHAKAAVAHWIATGKNQETELAGYTVFLPTHWMPLPEPPKE